MSLFHAFLSGVRDRSLWCSIASGLYLGAMLFILDFASIAHVWGFLHPPCLSLMHFMQTHAWLGMYVLFCALVVVLFVSLIRSIIVLIMHLFRRHFVWTLVSGRGAAARWYQVGRVARTLGYSLIAARLVLYFFAVHNICLIPSFSVSSLGPLEGGFHDCRKVFVVTMAEVPGGAVALMSMSLTIAHVGLEGIRLRWSLSQTSSIASFLVLMSSRFSPPSFRG